MTDSSIKIGVEDSDIVIRVPIKDLVWIVENDPEYIYKIHDPETFAKEIVVELENSKSHCNNDGMNAVEEMFQNAYEKVYEQGDDSIMTMDSDL